MKHIVEIREQALDKIIWIGRTPNLGSNVWLEYLEDDICNIELAYRCDRSVPLSYYPSASSLCLEPKVAALYYLPYTSGCLF